MLFDVNVVLDISKVRKEIFLNRQHVLEVLIHIVLKLLGKLAFYKRLSSGIGRVVFKTKVHQVMTLAVCSLDQLL